ncbi:MAG: GNAT family N-acetyltransferase [Candidatus Nephthysia bennettiae]|uniref:N-acetyltransferase n=1 Tax=Candidatus Nephthysia bennettiae TaxID=3127016 RepID=A0A934K3G4_9BACT|nr:N-acetyltransferase [Candidatus Dormibacteraeota bacterium]MBJ7612790.1 N-acetyltransferase [Candidatus Dormibacteraeota bacterium]PZR96280.1 MAG: GNAT family N-acetyltransferase [Candidatus Dormibacteraeota bacterium]
MPRVTVRPASPPDAAAVRAIYAPIVQDTAISFELVVPTVEEMAERIRRPRRRGRGLLRRAPRRWSVETSVYVDGEARRLGVGRLLYARLIELLRDHGFVNAFAGIALPNQASVTFHERFGYRQVGVFPAAGYKLGRWHDVGWWHRGLNEPVLDPAVPRGGTADRPPTA